MQCSSTLVMSGSHVHMLFFLLKQTNEKYILHSVLHGVSLVGTFFGTKPRFLN